MKGKTTMKKFFALLLALVMVLSLCACGAKEAPAAPAEDTTATETETAPAVEPIVLKIGISTNEEDPPRKGCSPVHR